MLRFYTRHIEQFGEEFFFHRIIQIITPQSLESHQQSPESPHVPPTPNDFTLTFHPEGGDIPTGIYTRIAFKALNTNGLGEDIRGVIVNQRGDTLSRIQSAHLGMGSFVFRMNRNEQFYAIVHNAAGLEKRFPLPQARVDAISLQVFRQRDNVVIGLSHDMRRLPRQLYITLQHRGEAIYSQQWNSNSEAIVIAEDDLPTGVIGITLTDSRGLPLSQRQIFNRNSLEVVNTIFTTDKETYNTRERVNATVFITDHQYRPLEANFAISVINNDIANYDAEINILSHLLLSSDLRGHIENPAYYFIADNENARAHLDLVMLTHGWSRFTVDRIIQESDFIFETSQTITGSLRDGFLRRSANESILMIVAEYGFIYGVKTDNEGRFRFDGFEFPEGTEFLLQSRRITEIRADERTFPDVNNFLVPKNTNRFSPISNEQGEETTLDLSLIQRFMQPDDGIWSLELSEVIIRPRRFRPRVRRPNESIFSSPFNHRMGREILEGLRAPNMQMLLRMVFPAFPFPTNPMAERPLIHLDNVELTYGDLVGFSADNVESIERVIKGFGFNSPAFLITTHNDSPTLDLPNITRITPLGYQITQEFFSPAYTTQAQRENPRADLRTTIYWNPSVNTDENGIANLHFYTSDHVGNYAVIIEGITVDGKIVHTTGRVR